MPAPTAIRTRALTAIAVLVILAVAVVGFFNFGALSARLGGLPSSWPGPSNTGVPAGTRLTALEGDLRVSSAGAVIDARDVSGVIYVNAPDVTIQRSRARQGIRNNSRNLQIRDSQIGPDSGLGTGFAGSGVGLGSEDFTCLRCDIRHLPDGVRANGGVTIEDSWIHDLGTNNHNDGIQRYAPGAAGNDVFRHNFIDMSSGYRNAAIFYSDDWRGMVTIDKNLLAGAYYTIQNLGSGTMRVTNNVWIRGSWIYGPFRFEGGVVDEFSGNTLDDGTPLSR